MPDQIDPLGGSSWSAPATVAGFRQSPPNETLLAFAARERGRVPHPVALDVGCGAARNTVPLAAAGWDVIGLDLSWAMLRAAVERAQQEAVQGRTQFALAPMDALPVAAASVELVIAHGIWNLARTTAEFRAGIREAARVARAGASLFVFTFSRSTLPPGLSPLAGEPFVFTEFSGQPQCFLSAEQLVAELADHGFDVDSNVPLRELNVPRPGTLRVGGPPVIYEGVFRRR
jgi:SAM-dependent methyltransferase